MHAMKQVHFNYATYFLALILLLVDLGALTVSFESAIYIRMHFFRDHLPPFDHYNLQKYYWIIALTLFMFIIENIYTMRYDFWADTKRIYKGFFYSAFAIFTLLTLGKVGVEYSRSFIIIFFAVAIFLVPIFKRYAKRYLFGFNVFKKNVKIVAGSRRADIIKAEIEKNWYLGLCHSQESYEMVIIVSRSFETAKLQQIIKEHSRHTKDIYVIPYMDHLDFSHASIVDYSNIRLSAIHIENRLLSPKNTFIKYLAEKLVVLLISPLVFLLHIVITVLIKLDSKGSVIFKQKRLGKDASTFSCYKYRTMYENGQEILDDYLVRHPEEITYYEEYHKYQDDPRITRIGSFLRKTSLDEFPQFYNILRGDMNLIGPRPYMLSEKEQIGPFHEDVILRVKPGITGLWQVSGRNELTFDQRVKLDNWYIQNWSLWIDFMIFVKTIKVVFNKVGAK